MGQGHVIRILSVIALLSHFPTKSASNALSQYSHLMELEKTGYVSSSKLPRRFKRSRMDENEQTPAEDRFVLKPAKYKYPFWGLPYGIYSQGGDFHQGLFPSVPGGYPPYDGVFGGPHGPGTFPGPSLNPFTTAAPPTAPASAKFSYQEIAPPPENIMNDSNDQYYYIRRKSTRRKKPKRPTYQYECDCDSYEYDEDCDCPSYYSEPEPKPKYKPKRKSRYNDNSRPYSYNNKKPKTTTERYSYTYNYRRKPKKRPPPKEEETPCSRNSRYRGKCPKPKSEPPPYDEEEWPEETTTTTTPAYKETTKMMPQYIPVYIPYPFSGQGYYTNATEASWPSTTTASYYTTQWTPPTTTQAPYTQPTTLPPTTTYQYTTEKTTTVPPTTTYQYTTEKTTTPQPCPVQYQYTTEKPTTPQPCPYQCAPVKPCPSQSQPTQGQYQYPPEKPPSPQYQYTPPQPQQPYAYSQPAYAAEPQAYNSAPSYAQPPPQPPPQPTIIQYVAHPAMTSEHTVSTPMDMTQSFKQETKHDDTMASGSSNLMHVYSPFPNPQQPGHLPFPVLYKPPPGPSRGFFHPQDTDIRYQAPAQQPHFVSPPLNSDRNLRAINSDEPFISNVLNNYTASSLQMQLNNRNKSPVRRNSYHYNHNYHNHNEENRVVNMEPPRKTLEVSVASSTSMSDK